MRTNDRIIVGIDVGTYKICTIVAEAEPGPGMINVLGVGAVASEGISKGLITDIVKATGAIAHSLEAAERQSGCRILSAYVSLSGNHISSFNSRGLVSVAHPDRVIGQDDVDRAIEAAKAVALPAGRDILHVIPRTYTIDAQEGIRNPVGLSGWRLDVETHMVTVASNVRENLIRCVQGADVEVDDAVLSPLAGAESTLTEQEKNLGVVYVDMGHGTTDLAIYVDGTVWHSKVIPVGGWQLSNDLSVVFNIPYEAAESLKLQYGKAALPTNKPKPTPQLANGKPHLTGNSLFTSEAYGIEAATYMNGNGNGNGNGKHEHGGNDSGMRGLDGEMLETRGFNDELKVISRDELNEVMESRLDQLFGMIGDEIRRSGYEGLLPGGVVLAGGVAAMDNIESYAQHKLKMPVRIGRPKKAGGLAEAFNSPAYAASVGLVLYGLKQSPDSQPGLRDRLKDFRPGANGHDGSGLLAKWLKKFLP
ncbi:MAG TPA: cell division protein FtsA [Chloroflexia bacterium]|nr:cell division protein FtsA [Chloroflexia bacterium]